jgi:hypothetical protein
LYQEVFVVEKIYNTFAGLSMYLSFILTAVSIVGFFVLAFYKGTDIEIAIPTILGIYITNRTAVKFSAHKAAIADEAVNTTQIISSTDDK